MSDPEKRHTLILHITPSERRALQLLADEKPVSEIASCLDITVSDLRSQLAILFARMGVSTIDEAASNALRRGLLTSIASTTSPADRVRLRRRAG
jgi:DNA-binding CsgD family transcriptional regulator